MPSDGDGRDTPSMLKRLLAAQDKAMVDALVGGMTYDEATGVLSDVTHPLTWAALLQLEQDASGE